MQNLKIENLVERYFEGFTSAEEEAKLRRFFMSDEVPAHLMAYKPLFAYFDREIKKSKTVRPPKRNIYVLWLSGIAASVAILAGVFIHSFQQTACPRSGNYVIIDGRCYTDEATIRSATTKTIHSVADDARFTTDDETVNMTEIIDSQLRNLDFLFNE